ncbi:MAG: carboxypeptidase regulatory-like domain-containing protein [Acidobacteria bacterium]|nr:carboxypeptidase regulatory-like domain-containing protein [Acidobacteriota bacterium]
MRSLVLLIAATLVAGQEAPPPPAPPGNSTAGPRRGPRPQSGPAAAPVSEGPKASITGQVISVTGEPLRKANVTISRVGRSGGDYSLSPSSNQSFSTDASGAFSFTNLDPGDYVLSVERTGYVRENYGRGVGRERRTAFPLAAGQDLKGITIKLTPHAVIAGKVLDEDGEPVSHSAVQALRYRYIRGRRQLVPAGSGQVNDLGEYRIAGLAPGRYFVAVMETRRFMMAGRTAGGRGETYAASYYPGVMNPAQAAPVEVAAGAEIRGIDLRLAKAPAFRVRGRVLDEAGNPAPRVMITAVPQGGELMVAGFGRNVSATQNDGSFELANLLPGQYILIANRMTREMRGQRSTARQEIVIGAEDLKGVALTLSPSFPLTVQVRVEGAENVNLPNARVTLEPADGMFFAPPLSNTVKDGSPFIVEGVNRERYRAGVSALPGSMYVKTIRMGSQEITDGIVDLTAGAGGPLEIILSDKAARVTGTVMGEEQKPAAAATVVLVPGGRGQQDLYKTAAADENGAFTIEGIAPGDYKLFAWQDIEDGAWFDAAVLAPLENSGVSARLKESDQQTLELKLLATPAGAQRNAQ